MSDEQPIESRVYGPAESINVPGEWWYLAAAANQITRIPTRENPDPYVEPLQAGHYALIVHNTSTAIFRELGSILFEPLRRSTTLHIRPATPDDKPYWRALVERLETIAYEARRLHDRTGRPTAEEIIERYYRARAAGRKITLRELAEEYGFNVKYLSNAKAKYDREGRWGSKAHK